MHRQKAIFEGIPVEQSSSHFLPDIEKFSFQSHAKEQGDFRHSSFSL